MGGFVTERGIGGAVDVGGVVEDLFDADVLNAFAAHCAVVLGVEVEAVRKALVEAVGAAIGVGHGDMPGYGVWVERWRSII